MLKKILIGVVLVFVGLVIVGMIVGSPPETTASAPAAGAQATPATTEPRPGVTMANYTRIQEGMTYREVVAILGKPGVEQSSSDMAGIRTIMYSWDGTSFGANMNAMFQNDRLVTKAQFGLR